MEANATELFHKVKDVVWPDYDEIREFKFIRPGARGPLFLGWNGNWSDHYWPFCCVIFYVVSIYTLRKIWETFNIPKLNLKWYAFFHNIFLSLFSLHVTLAIAWDLKNLYYEADLHALLCDTKSVSNRGRLMWWYYLFYLSKFFELIETYMLVLTRRPIIFLHVYHHFITLIISYVNIVADVGPQWVVIIANSSVHIVMYFYYALKTLGYNPWWKKYVTKFQIVQFLFDLGMAIVGFTYMYYNDWSCSGGVKMWLFDITIVFSFLLLFLSFYRNTYSQRRVGSPGAAKAGAKATAAGGKKLKAKKAD